METEELKEIPGLKPEDVVVIRKFDYGLKSDLSDKATEITLVNGRESARLSLSSMKIYTLVYGIIKAPFFEGKTEEADKFNAVRGLDSETGDYIFERIGKFNKSKLDAELKKN